MNKISSRNIKFLVILLLVFSFFGYYSYTLAATPNAFVVEVQPSSFEANQPVDLIVKAVNNGEIIKEYNGDVFIEIDGDIDPQKDYVVPSEGLYTFVPQDQGIKIFSKGIQIKKAGTFKVKISDITDDSIAGEATVIVGTPGGADIKDVEITSPVAGVIEKNNIINIFGVSSQLPNSPIQYYVNDILVQQGITDSAGNFNAYLTGIVQGQNILRVKIVDSTDTVLGESDQVSFNYQPVTDETFKGIEIIPLANIKQGDQVIFNVNTKDGISSVQLKLSDGKTYPMDRVTAGQFSKKVNMETEGEILVSLEIIDAGNKKTYDNIQTLTVGQGTSIKNIKFFTDLIDQNTLTIKWEVIGIVPTKFKIEYGTGQDLLDQSANVDTNELFVENINPDIIYYFKITPLNEDLSPIGSSSDVVSFNPAGPTCIVQNIIIYDEKIGDKHYLVRSGVENVDKYIVYRSDFETSDISQMKKVGETTDTRFEYPFNQFSKKDEYAFYIIQALCKDGKEVKIDNVKKVQVGPVENVLLVIMFSVFAYSLYRLYQYGK
ncbi:MAG: hypothetical protein WAZ12_02415 [Candidatus Absconditicoccaceae bacterium]